MTAVRVVALSAILAASLALLSACSSADEETKSTGCASGVTFNGQCLVAKDGGAPVSTDDGGAFGTAPGAKCLTEGDLVCGATDAADNLVVSCQKEAFAKVFQCDPGVACENLTGHTSVHCGSGEAAVPYAVEGARCATEGAAACAFDRARVLGCKAGAWYAAQTCEGASARCERTATGTSGQGWSCPATSTAGCVVCK